MKFADLIGQEHAGKLLKQSIASGRLAHAYLFAGPDGVGKKTCAQIFARALNCLEGGEEPCDRCSACSKDFHPDIRLLQPKNDSLRIEQIREMQDSVVYKPYEGKWKIYIIEDADKLTEAAANSLLKTLEEPPPATIFILLTAKPEHILPTIRSRCQQINFRALGQEKILGFLANRYPDVEADKRDLAAFLAEGSMGKACALLENQKAWALVDEVQECYAELGRNRLAPFTLAEKWSKRKEELGDFFQILTLLYRRSMWENIDSSKLKGIYSSLLAIEETERALTRHANTQLALEKLFITLAKEREEQA